MPPRVSMWFSVSIAQFNLIIMFSSLPAALPVCHLWTCHLCRSRTYDMWMPGMASSNGRKHGTSQGPCFSVSGDSALRFAVNTLFTPGALQAPGEPLCLAIVWQVSVYLTWHPDVASPTWKLAEWAQDLVLWSAHVGRFYATSSPTFPCSSGINTSSP